MDKNNIVELDVRPILASGVDPFDAIMAKLKEIDKTKTLLIINTFEPIPILNILKTKGYRYEVERPENGVVYTYLIADESNKAENQLDNISSKNRELSFDDLEQKFSGKLKEIDVRDLEMPMPMVTVLETLELLDPSEALYVHNKKLPQYLLPELDNRNYKLVSKEIDENNLKLIIYK